jgi:hypothetical protein
MAGIVWNPADQQTNGFVGVPEYILSPTRAQIDFEDSYNCGGTNANTQSFTARGSVRAGYIDVTYRGRVERQNSEFERIELTLECDLQPEFQNETLIFRTGSYNDGAGCAMSHTPKLDYIYPNTDFVQIISSTDPGHTTDIPGGKTIRIKKLKGNSLLRVNMYTGDGLYHTNAYLRLDFVFGKENLWSVGRVLV